MSNCSSGCPTQDHDSYGECLRSKGMRIGWARSHLGVDFTRQKKWDKRLAEYRDARRQGIQPASSKLRDIRAAVDISNKTGVAFRADS
jgi:hypothetical protein